MHTRALTLTLLALAGCASPDGGDGGALDARSLHDGSALDASRAADAGAALDGPALDALASVFADFATDSGDAGAADFSLASADLAAVVAMADLAWVDGGAADLATGDAAAEAAESVDHADRALERLLLHYWDGSQQYLLGAPPSANLAGYWIFAQAFDALLDGVERSQSHRFVGLVETFYLAQQERGFARDFFDDETWMALALLRAFDLTGATKYLDEAEALLSDVRAQGWDGSCCGPSPGGVWWDRKHTQKATASNAGPVIAAARLAARKNDPNWLAFAVKVYAFWSAHRVDGATHQVADHIAADGTVFWWRFSYNEGLMIGAALELHRATKSAAYLADAQAIAGFTLAKETVPSGGKSVLFDGDNAHCQGDCAAFKGIADRYLSALAEAAPAPALTDVLTTSAQTLWSTARDPATDLFATNWVEAPAPPITLAADASATMALAAFSRLLGAASKAPAPGVYEAEEGVLHHLGLEASHLGFAGWGYVAGWNQDGQWLDFPVNVPAAGNYKLTLRYAAGAGNASRYLFIDGKSVVASLSFPATKDWNHWAEITTNATLSAGSNTISVIFSSKMASKSDLNLDQLTISP